MDLLGLFANQAAIALDLLRRARKAEAVLSSSVEGAGIVAQLAATIESLEDERRAAGLKAIAALEEVLRNDEGGDYSRPRYEASSTRSVSVGRSPR